MLQHNLLAILRALNEAGVEFIVVGGIAAILDGAPLNTFDLDVVHSRDGLNIARLLRVLADLDAVYRLQPELRLRPGETHLASPGHQNLATRHGPLDLLGSIGRNLGYEELLPHSADVDIGEGVRVRVLKLEMLISIKEELGSEKDRAALPILRRTLEEKKKRVQA